MSEPSDESGHASAEELAYVTSQLQTARANVVILTENVAALKRLASQLALQLDEAKMENQKLSDKLRIAEMRSHRDAIQDLTEERKGWEQRLEAMRKQLEETQGLVSSMRDAAVAHETKWASQMANAVLAKDRLIDDLRRDVDLLRARLADNESRSAPSRRPAARGRIAAAPTNPLGLGHSSDIVRPWCAKNGSVWVSMSSDDVDGRVILEAKVYVDNTIGYAPTTAGGAGGSTTRYHIRVGADASFLDDVLYPDDPWHAFARQSILDGALSEKRAFVAASGHVVRIAVDIAPAAVG